MTDRHDLAAYPDRPQPPSTAQGLYAERAQTRLAHAALGDEAQVIIQGGLKIR